MTSRFSRSLVLALLLLPAASQAQSLLLDNFIYTSGTPLTANGWTAISAAGTNAVTVTAANLTQPTYPGSSGNAVSLVTTGEDVSRAFTAPVTAGTVYAAALINVTAAQASGDYFFHFSQSASILVGRVFARAATGGFQFGISKTGTFTTAVFGPTTYTLNTPYLVVLKYEFIGAAGTDDPVGLFVFAPGDTYTTEPAAPIASFTTGTDPVSIVGLNLRQGASTVAPTAIVDGIRVGRTWNDAVLATQTVDDGAGYRLLGAPVNGVTVGTLAGINLVQGVAGQYPTASANLFTSYTGSGTSAGYVGATSTAQAVLPGRGFFWYLYDQALTPGAGTAGGGTSLSYTVPERPLFASGPVAVGEVVAGFSINPDGFYLIANPFAQPLSSVGISSTGTNGGTFSTTLQAYDPASGECVGQPDDVAAGIRWAITHGARVLNLSLGPDVPGLSRSTAIPAAVDEAAQAGVVVVFSAGNASLPVTDSYDDNALIVAATGPSGALASYSQRGAGVDLAAPGGDPVTPDVCAREDCVLSLFPGDRYSNRRRYLDGRAARQRGRRAAAGAGPGAHPGAGRRTPADHSPTPGRRRPRHPGRPRRSRRARRHQDASAADASARRRPSAHGGHGADGGRRAPCARTPRCPGRQ